MLRLSTIKPQKVMFTLKRGIFKGEAVPEPGEATL
jgi:hypothetical protein